MACHNCVAGLMFTVTSDNWALVTVREGGYPLHLLGLKPVRTDMPNTLVVRVNTHYPVNINRFQGKSFRHIEFTLLCETSTPPNSCPHNPFTPDIDNLSEEQNRLKNLGFSV